MNNILLNVITQNALQVNRKDELALKNKEQNFLWHWYSTLTILENVSLMFNFKSKMEMVSMYM